MQNHLFEDLLLKARQFRNNLTVVGCLPAESKKRFEAFKYLTSEIEEGEIDALTVDQLAELKYNLAPKPTMTEAEAAELIVEAEAAGYTIHR